MIDARRPEFVLRPPPLNLDYRLLDRESGGHFSTQAGAFSPLKGGRFKPALAVEKEAITTKTAETGGLRGLT
jgi:hypothetical protein